MLLSVLMCVYKESTNFLRESIESILNQTYGDFEFVIVGDTPESDRERVFGLIEEYAQNDKRIIFVQNEKNVGLTRSLNIGLKYCSAKYVARMDADDISLPTRFEKQIIFMEKNPHILASSTWYEEFSECGKQKIMRTDSNPKHLRVGILYNCIMSHPASMFRRIIEDEEVRYDVRYKYSQDYALWLWILQHGDISICEEVLLKYRITDGQISNSKKIEQQECAKAVQRRAFVEMYNFPEDNTFLRVLSDCTISRNNTIPEDIMKHAFRDFLAKTRLSKKNCEAVRSLIIFYIKYCSSFSSKRSYAFIYDISRKNLKIFMLFECEYFYNRTLAFLRQLKNAYRGIYQDIAC